MEMYAHLDSDIFDVVVNGTKHIEARINDEKRRNLHVGDKLIFLRRPDEVDRVETIIEDLVYYDSFKDMVQDYSIDELYLAGYSKEDYLNLLRRFYTDMDQQKYGVVAIKFKKL